MTPQKPSDIANLAADPPSATVLRDMSARLTARLKAAGDQREVIGQAPWDGWEYHGRKAQETHPE